MSPLLFWIGSSLFTMIGSTGIIYFVNRKISQTNVVGTKRYATNLREFYIILIGCAVPWVNIAVFVSVVCMLISFMITLLLDDPKFNKIPFTETKESK